MAWFKAATAKSFTDFADLRGTFGTADQVGYCTVFDVGNNRFRVIGRVNYRMRRIYVLAMLTHSDYDGMTWVEDCGCRQPPPKVSARSKRP